LKRGALDEEAEWIIVLAAVFSVRFLFLDIKDGPRRKVPRTGIARTTASDANVVIFLDFDELRRAPFIAKLYAWAPKPPSDADYAQFLRETGFDYERDLHRMAVAVKKQRTTSVLFAIADGKFDRAKITAYASKLGMVGRNGGREIYSVPVSGTPKKISFAFLKNDRIALTDDTDLSVYLNADNRMEEAAEWRTRFERLAGSPIFAVIRQDAGAGSALARRLPAACARRNSPHCSINSSGLLSRASRTTSFCASLRKGNALPTRPSGSLPIS